VTARVGTAPIRPAGSDERYRTAFLDWLACAAAGSRESPARAARETADGLLGRVAAAGAAGHVLDYDDTYLPGLAHLSAPTAPAALVLGAERGASVGDVLSAYAAGFESAGALTAANHPSLRERGWHPTAVCGAPAAAVTAAQLLGLAGENRRRAVALSLLRAGGLVTAFGSDGKSLQVGMAAAAGVEAALLASRGASVRCDAVEKGFEAAYGARWDPVGERSAIEENWVKAYPCCLQTHSAIEAAAEARDRGAQAAARIEVVVHPVSLHAAVIADPADGLEAKFSIPYLVAYTLLHGPPTVDAFRGVDREARSVAAERIRLETDHSLLESEAVLEVEGERIARVEAALGSPARPMDAERLRAKVRELVDHSLDGVLDDGAAPAAIVLAAAGLE
jgi:2-methylcitrate dehydratase PrpD